MTFGENILLFFQSLKLDARLPSGIDVMNPYQDNVTFALCEKFYDKFYNDAEQRTLILGINPGRFGAGVTGIPFTDPIKLEIECGIANNLKKKPELSADFIYALIKAFGGVKKFYHKFYISAISPLGFTKDGKNLNYYDVKDLTKAIEPFIIDSIKRQLTFGINNEVCFCLGEGENFRYLQKLNQQHQFFKTIEALAHPRFIMQYRRKLIPQYIDIYLTKLAPATPAYS